ncbi:Copia protein [Phytophthora fragariae]|uniref:Copia protein n=2 Tax=Phytophthora fragariae TaxID=53985 RepID=A0A6A3R7C4_9STRA|nr:Copia protein [Phytophthora fragariae]KAE9090712.1 Copia protein [Phytophthora fragariae]KAE9274429.1 Copia protein [Phytophthora fragariae]
MEVDETGEQATNMEVEPASHTVVSLTGGCSALQSNGSMRSSETSEVDLRADRHSGLLPSIAEPNQAPRLPASSSSSRAIGGSEPARDLLFSENRIVFSGGSRPGRSARSDQTRLLTNGDVDRGEVNGGGDVPLLTNEPHMNSQEENEVGEPDPKRPRLDEYEIALAATDVPGSYREAMSSPEAKQWKEAVRREIRAHIRNHTWDTVRHPHGVKVIGCKWVFAYKFDEHGNIVRYKARLVALGCLQTRGVDYYYTYSPVASTNTIRVFLSVCCNKRLKIRQFDIETAFLNGTLDEDVYMAVPQGVRADGGMVCKLRRSLYGLKQAAAVWFKTIRAAFVAMGFVQCRADPCFFVRLGKNGQSPVYIVIYVDDLLVGCTTDAEADEICAALSSRFTVKSLGDARYVLGMEIEYARNKGELVVRQTQFIKRMLERFGQVEANSVRNPVVLGQDFAPDDSHDMFEDARSYREVIGSLLYVANATRPDISADLSSLSQYLDCPREMHWRAALRVLHFLKGTFTRGIRFCCESGDRTGIRAYADANWGGDKQTRRSTSGVLLLLGGGPVVYKSKRQNTVALSSAEAEYMALSLAAQEVLWLRYLLVEMGFKAEGPTTLQLDNKSAIAMATNQGYTPRAKHIDLRAHFVRDHVEAGRIKLKHVPTEEQLADFLTKALPTPRLMQLCNASGVVDVGVLSIVQIGDAAPCHRLCITHKGNLHRIEASRMTHQVFQGF